MLLLIVVGVLHIEIFLLFVNWWTTIVQNIIYFFFVKATWMETSRHMAINVRHHLTRNINCACYAQTPMLSSKGCLFTFSGIKQLCYAEKECFSARQVKYLPKNKKWKQSSTWARHTVFSTKIYKYFFCYSKNSFEDCRPQLRKKQKAIKIHFFGCAFYAFF